MEENKKEKQVLEEEMQELAERLLGNQAFGRLRGFFTPDLGVLATILEQSESPSDFCRRWDQFSSDARVIGNLLACLRRDGKPEAFRELSRTLQDKAYRLPGETIQLEETQVVTLVIFGFPQTLKMIRWIRCADWSSINSHLEDLDSPRIGRPLQWGKGEPGQKWLKSIDRQLTQEMFDAFPSLEKFGNERRRRGDYEGPELEQAYAKHLYEKSQLHKFSAFSPLRLAWETYNDHLEIHELYLGFLCILDQAEFLSAFSRKEQKDIATWSIRMPKVSIDNGLERYFFGFHPESAHDEWKKESRHFASIGCSHGYGVVAMPKRYFHPLHHHTKRHHKDCCISQVYLDDLHQQVPFELAMKS